MGNKIFGYKIKDDDGPIIMSPFCHLDGISPHGRYEFFSKFKTYNDVDEKGTTLLIQYIRNADIIFPHVIETMIESGIDVNHVDNQGKSALIWLAWVNTSPLEVW